MITRQVFIRTVSVYVVAYIVLLATILGLMYAYPKPELHMLVNSQHTSFLDTFFKYISVLAEWPLYVIALLPLLWKRFKFPLFFAVCELSGGTVLQILKHLISACSRIILIWSCPWCQAWICIMAIPSPQDMPRHSSCSAPAV